MPKIYYTPTSCGAASFIAAHIAGLNWEAEPVKLDTHLTASGVDFYSINPKGNVPALVLDNGVVLNENASVLQYIADQVPGLLAAPYGEVDRYLLMQSLNYTTSEVHPLLGGLFNPEHTEETRAFYHKLLGRKLKFMEENLVRGRQYLVGDSLTVADLYLYLVLTWAPMNKVDLEPYPNVLAWFNGIKTNPRVQSDHTQMATNPGSTN
jgi:glutathione S-transferase